ncbi:MAG: hypothetical protein L3J59_12200 [Methylococcaceae bacterium]|nr:hypothetical protein [Methylococcaceae bacterium]
MAIGKVGVQTSVFQGTSITIVLYVSINLLEFFLNDDTTKAMFFGKLASDITKAVISGSLALAVGSLVAGATTFAVVPIVVAIFVATLSGAVLYEIDEHYELTKKLIEALKQADKKLDKGYRQLEKEVRWKLKGGGMSLPR